MKITSNLGAIEMGFNGLNRMSLKRCNGVSSKCVPRNSIVKFSRVPTVLI